MDVFTLRPKVHLMCPEDVFLFKGIAERNADLDDMRVLAGIGLIGM